MGRIFILPLGLLSAKLFGVKGGNFGRNGVFRAWIITPVLKGFGRARHSVRAVSVAGERRAED